MPVSLRLEPELEQRYSHLAETTGRTKSYYMNMCLRDGIDQLEHDFLILNDREEIRRGIQETYTLDEVRQHCGLDN